MKIKSLVIDEAAIGTEDDRDILFYQEGFSKGDVVAEGSIFLMAEGKEFDLVVKLNGQCKVMIRQDGDGNIFPYDSDEGDIAELRYEPELCKEAIKLENKKGDSYLHLAENPWLEIEIKQNGKLIGSWYDTYGTVFGSIQECREVATDDAIQQFVNHQKENNIFADNFDDDYLSGVRP